MTRAVLADAGPLFAAVDEGDAHHRDAQNQLHTLDRQRREVLIAYPVILEAHSLVLYRLGIDAAHKWLNYLAGVSLINPTVEDYGRAQVLVKGFPDQRITLVDAALAALANRLGIEVWTYDHHFDVMRVPVWRG